MISMKCIVIEFFQQADSSIVKIENLSKNTSYNVIASIFTGNLEYRHIVPMKTFQTLNNDDYIPQTISNDTITLDITPDIDSSALFATIEWKPTTGGHILIFDNKKIYNFIKLMIILSALRYDL